MRRTCRLCRFTWYEAPLDTRVDPQEIDRVGDEMCIGLHDDIVKIVALVDQGEKTQAIKYLRSVEKDLSLSEAKELVERWHSDYAKHLKWQSQPGREYA